MTAPGAALLPSACTPKWIAANHQQQPAALKEGGHRFKHPPHSQRDGPFPPTHPLTTFNRMPLSTMPAKRWHFGPVPSPTPSSKPNMRTNPPFLSANNSTCAPGWGTTGCWGIVGVLAEVGMRGCDGEGIKTVGAACTLPPCDAREGGLYTHRRAHLHTRGRPHSRPHSPTTHQRRFQVFPRPQLLDGLWRAGRDAQHLVHAPLAQLARLRGRGSGAWVQALAPPVRSHALHLTTLLAWLEAGCVCTNAPGTRMHARTHAITHATNANATHQLDEAGDVLLRADLTPGEAHHDDALPLGMCVCRWVGACPRVGGRAKVRRTSNPLSGQQQPQHWQHPVP